MLQMQCLMRAERIGEGDYHRPITAEKVRIDGSPFLSRERPMVAEGSLAAKNGLLVNLLVLV